jgi:L-asparaginase II
LDPNSTISPIDVQINHVNQALQILTTPEVDGYHLNCNGNITKQDQTSLFERPIPVTEPSLESNKSGVSGIGEREREWEYFDKLGKRLVNFP